MQQVLVKYSEIGLKGKNRRYFEKSLIKNIRQSAKFFDARLENVRHEVGRVVCFFDDDESNDKICECLKNVLGIKFFSFVYEVEKDIDSMVSMAKKLMEEEFGGCKSISFKTKRADKNFPLISPDVNAKFGEVAVDLGIDIDYKNLEERIFTEITYSKVYMYAKKIYAYCGLPVNTSGRVLVLLSGGIDSPVAAFNMMRRGVKCDFLHVHMEMDNEVVMSSKIRDTVNVLNKFQYKSKLYLVPYSNYEFLTSGKINPRYELVFFKHFLLRLVDKVAKDMNYDAIVTGDNLAQVASQTMDNLNAASLRIERQIFRPLLCYEKEEIIAKAKEIGTYDLAIQSYKDCCSIHSKNPLTKAKLDKMNAIIDEFDVENLLEKSVADMKQFDIRK